MWRVLLSLLILFSIGKAAMFFLNREQREKLSYTEIMLYSFSMGYVVLTIMTVTLAQFGFLTSPMSLLAIVLLPALAACFWVYRKRRHPSIQNRTQYDGDQLYQEQNISNRVRGFLSSVRFSHIILLSIFAAGLILRLETQLTVPWLGDQDPYYHLSFIDSIIAQGTLPSRTFWGFYSYPPSFHLVSATLISTVQIDRYLFMKVVPEFLGFLCVPAVYALVKRQYDEWAGIASAAFLAICSIHIYRTNIPIPEPMALLGMLMFFHAMTALKNDRKYLFAGFFVSMIFLTNPIGMLYFLLCTIPIFLALLSLRRWNEVLGYLKATVVGLAFSGIFWLPTLYRLGLNGIFQGWGPSYPYYGVFSYNSNTYFSWFGWGACLLALLGFYVCLKETRKSLILLLPTVSFAFLIEAGNNGFFVLEATVLFRGLLFLGTWVSLLAGIGFGRIMRTTRKKAAVTGLLVVVVLTALSFPVFSGERYPVNWGYEDVDFVYRSYLSNYSSIFKNRDYAIYCADLTFNYGAFENVVLSSETPQIVESLLRNDNSVITQLVNEYNVKYLVFQNGTREAEFLRQSNLTYVYYEDWHTIVLGIKQ
jgi:hypothetical protein